MKNHMEKDIDNVMETLGPLKGEFGGYEGLMGKVIIKGVGIQLTFGRPKSQLLSRTEY